MKKIKIKYSDGAYHLKKIKKGDMIDCANLEPIEMKKGEFKLINLGFACELPKGYMALLFPRSSTYKKYGLIQANSIGVIDNSFSSDEDIWHFPVIATRDISIPANTRLCQFYIAKQQPRLKFIEVNHLNNKTRGGFGSTGA